MSRESFRLQAWQGLSQRNRELWSKDYPLGPQIGLKRQALVSLMCSVIVGGLPERGVVLAGKLGHCIWRLSPNCIPCSKRSQSSPNGHLGVHPYGCHKPQIIFLQLCGMFEEISLSDAKPQLSFTEHLS